jgi:hypothetical protein
MSSIGPDVMAFDVERALAKALGIRVETYLVDQKSDEYRFRIGQRWNFRVDREQLEQLWSDTDSPSAMRDTFDALKADCLAFQDVKR